MTRGVLALRSAADTRRRSGGAPDALDPDGASFPHGLREVVGRLKPKPRICAAAERLVETDRHFRRDSRMAIEDVGELLAADAELLSRVRHAQAERLKAVMAY